MTKIKDFNSPSNKPLIVLDYWSKNSEEDFDIHHPSNMNISEKYTTQNVINDMNTTVKHVKYMEQGMIGLQDKFV